jgi:peptide/nickel transport system substrate-binding protein
MGRNHSLLVATGLVGSLLTLTGASVSYYEESLPTTMNPLFARTMVDNRTHELVFDRLFYRSPITNELMSRLVDKFEKLDNGMSLKVTLKPGIKWHDGQDLGSDDICFTINAILDPKTPATIAKEYRESIAGCDALVKERAAVVRFKKIYHEPREHLGFDVLPKHSFPSTAITPDLDFSKRPIGTGPMKGARGTKAVTFDMFANGHHNAKITQLQMAEGGDPQVQVTTVLAGGVQGIISVAPPLRPQVAASDDVALKSYDLRSWWFIALNTNKDALKDKRIRQALNLSIDRQELRELTIGVDAKDPNPPCEFISGPFVQSSPYYNRAVKPVETADRAKAKELMTAAGAADNAGRWVYKGAPLTLKIGMNGPLDIEAKDLMNQIGNQLQAGGYDRAVYRVNPDDWASKAVPGKLTDFDMLIGKWSFGLVEDVNQMFQTRAGTKGTQNIFNYSNPAVDALLTRYDDAKTDTEAKDAYHELHAMLSDELPYLFLWKLDTKSAWRNSVRNNTIGPYYYFTMFDEWKFEDGSGG